MTRIEITPLQRARDWFKGQSHVEKMRLMSYPRKIRLRLMQSQADYDQFLKYLRSK